MGEYDDFLDSLRDNKIRGNKAYLCRTDFLSYLLNVFYIINGSKFKLKPFHKKVIYALQKLVDCKNERRNLALCLPVGSGKSLITEYFITWCFARSVNNTFCYTSHSDKLINKLSKECKDIIENPHWTLLFGNKLKKDDRQRVNFSFEGAKNRTGLTAATTGGAITGLDAGNPNIEGFSGALIIDDPMDAGNGRYENARAEVVTFYDEKLSTRRRTPTTPTILIMQRLHLDDLIGWIEKNEPEDWEIVKIPAIDENGVSFWAERYPIEELEKIRKINNFKFQSQYQQDPIASGGNVIKRDYFRYYPTASTFNYKRILISGDTAMKVKEHNDYSVFVVGGVTDDNRLHVLDLVRGKWEAPDLEKVAVTLWNKWKTNPITGLSCNGFYIEDKASGTGLIQGLKAKYGIPVFGVKADTDKLTRCENVLPYIESGQVLLPESENYSFVPDLLAECEAFSRDMSHLHDDQVDSLGILIQEALGKTVVSLLDYFM